MPSATTTTTTSTKSPPTSPKSSKKTKSSNTMSTMDGGPIPPKDFCCPITGHLMEQPMQSVHGQNYEKLAIMKWLESGKRYCPVSGKAITVEGLQPNSSLQWKIRYWQMKNDQEPSETNWGDDEEQDETIKLLPQARFICPLTGKVMVDPVMTREGHNFERTAMMKWIEMRGAICPISGSTLVEPYVVSNSKLAWEIKQWLLTVSDYADDLEFDEETNTVRGTMTSGGGVNASSSTNHHRHNKKHHKKRTSTSSSSKKKDKVSTNATTTSSGGDAPTSPKPRSFRGLMGGGGGGGMAHPSSAPAGGATQKKHGFKLRSPKFIRNMLRLPAPMGVDLDLEDSERSKHDDDDDNNKKMAGKVDTEEVKQEEGVDNKPFVIEEAQIEC